MSFPSVSLNTTDILALLCSNVHLILALKGFSLTTAALSSFCVVERADMDCPEPKNLDISRATYVDLSSNACRISHRRLDIPVIVLVELFHVDGAGNCFSTRRLCHHSRDRNMCDAIHHRGLGMSVKKLGYSPLVWDWERCVQSWCDRRSTERCSDLYVDLALSEIQLHLACRTVVGSLKRLMD
jgi:hypothetical protein